jgi:hypothetical protein
MRQPDIIQKYRDINIVLFIILNSLISKMFLAFSKYSIYAQIFKILKFWNKYNFRISNLYFYIKKISKFYNFVYFIYFKYI